MGKAGAGNGRILSEASEVEAIEPKRPGSPDRPDRPARGWDAPEQPPSQNRVAGVADAAALRQALHEELNRAPPVSAGSPSLPLLIVLCGLPGTGKSYFAAALASRVPCIVLGSDRLRKILAPQPRYTRGEHSRIFTAAHCLLEQLLTEGCPVIFDATNLTERARQPLYDIADRTGAQLLLIKFSAPEALIRQRLARRGERQAAGLSSNLPSCTDWPNYTDWSDADWRIYCRLRPGEEPPQRPHCTVDSSCDIAPTVAEIARLIGE